MDITPILNYLNANMPSIALALFCLQIITLILLLIVAIRSRRQGRRIAALLQTKSGDSLEDLINGFLHESKQAGQERAELLRQLDSLRSDFNFAVQRIGFVRYNAFPGVGGEMSFSIALLNGARDGFVLTSIFGREEARVYAKEIKQGQPQVALSAEEQAAVLQAEQSKGR